MHPPRTLIRLGIVSRTFYYTPLWMALAAGEFARRGLDLQIDLIGHRDQAALLANGDCDIAIAPPDGIFQDAARGGDAVILAGNSARLSHCLIVQPEVERFEQLRGKRIGVLSLTEGSFFHFQQLARAFGMRFPQEFVVVETGGAPLRHELLVSGSIDAGLQSFPWVEAGERAGMRKLLEISDYVPVWQFNTVNSHRRWCRSHPETMNTFVSVLADATERFYTEPDLACRVAASQMGLSEELARGAWEYFARTRCLTRDLSLSRAGMHAVHTCLREAGRLGSDLDIERVCEGPAMIRIAD